MDTGTLLHHWTLYLAASGLTAKTVWDYTYALTKFSSWPGDGSHPGNMGRDLRTMTDLDLSVFLALAIGAKAHSRQQYVKALRNFYGWLHTRGEIEQNPLAVVNPRRPRRTPQEPFTRDELTALVLRAHLRHPRRGAAILACYALGTRRSEFAGIRLEDIDWDHRKVRVLGKGPKVRRINVGPLAATALQDLIALGPEPRGTVPGTLLGIRPVQFAAWVSQAARDCGFPGGRKRRTHTLRATAATMMDHARVPAAVIAEFLGHENVSTTGIYLGLFDGDQARAAEVL
jgi:site-specific recombinase XerD